jgi:hypothetical protein
MPFTEQVFYERPCIIDYMHLPQLYKDQRCLEICTDNTTFLVHSFRGARWSSGQCAQLLITKAKQRS